MSAGDVGFVSRLYRPWPRSVNVLGLLVMVGAGVAARQYQLFWYVVVSGCAATVLCLVLGPVMLVAVLGSPHAAAAAACLWWLVQARVIAEIDRSIGPGWHSERQRWSHC